MNVQGLFHHPQIQWRVTLWFFSVLFGLLCILPNIWQRFDATYPFHGVEILGGDQEHYYAARIREVQDGHWNVGSVYYAEEKSQPFLQPPVPEWVMGGLGLLLGIPGISTVLFAKFLFGGLLFLIMTMFFARLFGARWIALIVVSALLFAGPLLSSPASFMEIFTGEPPFSDFLRFARITNPQFSSTLFFLTLFLFVVWLQSHHRPALGVAAVLTGISFFVYPYTWTYLLAFIGLLTLYTIIRRDWKRTQELMMAEVIILFFALFFAVHFVHVSANPAYAELAERFGMVSTREPIVGVSVFFFLIVAFAVRRSPNQSMVLQALALSAIIVLNQQILTGKTIVPHHYHWYYIQPLAFISTFMTIVGLGAQLLRRNLSHSTLVGLTALCLAFFILWGVRLQGDSYRATRKMWGSYQSFGGALKFFSVTHVTDTVYAPDALREFIPIYTSADVYHAGNANIGCLCSLDHLRDAYFFDLWVEGVTIQQASKLFFTTKRAEVSGRLYGIHYREAEGAYENIPDAVLHENLKQYNEFLKLSLQEKIALHPLRFVALPVTQPKTTAVLSLISKARLVFEDSSYRIWDISPLVSMAKEGHVSL